MTIAIITSGGLEMGMGHVYRSLTLAEELSEKTVVRFFTISDETVRAKIKDNGFSVTALNSSNEILESLIAIRPHVVIIDNLDVEESFA